MRVSITTGPRSMRASRCINIYVASAWVDQWSGHRWHVGDLTSIGFTLKHGPGGVAPSKMKSGVYVLSFSKKKLQPFLKNVTYCKATNMGDLKPDQFGYYHIPWPGGATAKQADRPSISDLLAEVSDDEPATPEQELRAALRKHADMWPAMAALANRIEELAEALNLELESGAAGLTVYQNERKLWS